MRPSAPCVILLALAVSAAGCASPRSSFYTLNATAKPVPAAADYAVSVGPVSVPSAVDRPQIVLRVAPHEVAVDQFHRWASPLPEAIARVVAEDLAAILGTPRVTVFSGRTAAGARYRVLVDVIRFDSAPGEAATLEAAWEVRSTPDGATRAGRTAVAEPSSDREFAALAAAHSRALGRLSADVADAIRTMEGGR